MLYFISIWTLLLLGCCGCGLGLLHLLEVTIPRRTDPSIWRSGDRAILAVWLGTIAISITLLATALFLPLSPQVGGAILLGFLPISLKSRSTRMEIFALYRRISKMQIVIYLSVAISIAALFSHPVRWYDTGLYHYSLVHWLANFGTVPGLALLFPNFGFTSAWFAFSAPLAPDWAIERTSATANGFIFLLTVLQLLMSVGRLHQQQGRLSDWFVAIYFSCVLLFTTIPITVIPDILVSPSPDIPALLLVSIVTWAILVVETDASKHRFALARQIVPLCLAVGAVAIKLTTLPLLLVTGLWFVVRAGFNRQLIQRIGIATAMASLLLVPLLLSNLVSSGCPIYPSATFCLDLPWTVEIDRSVSNATHHWISWYGKPPAGIHPWLWALQLWLKNSGNQGILATIALSTGCVIYLLKTLMSNVGKLHANLASSMWLMAISFVGIGFFLLTSPLNRFMLPYLFIVPALTIATYCQTHVDAHRLSVNLPLKQTTHVAIFLLSIATISTVIQIRTNYSILFLPPSIQQIATVKHQINDVTYWSPVGGKDRGCWTIELPCAYNPSQIRLRQPELGIKAGFIRK